MRGRERGGLLALPKAKSSLLKPTDLFSEKPDRLVKTCSRGVILAFFDQIIDNSAFSSSGPIFLAKHAPGRGETVNNLRFLFVLLLLLLVKH